MMLSKTAIDTSRLLSQEKKGIVICRVQFDYKIVTAFAKHKITIFFDCASITIRILGDIVLPPVSTHIQS